MGLAGWIILGVAWLAWCRLASRALDNERGDPKLGLALALNRVYCRLVHRVEVRGREHVPGEPGPLIVVSNHTAGIDPLLIQSACPFEIRWMMAIDMMKGGLDEFWAWVGVIPVDRFGRDTRSARAAISHVRGGGVLGVFPEGRLERPARRLLPFLPGLGVVAARTGARLLPVVVEGTPQTAQAWGSLLRRSRSIITFYPIVEPGPGQEAGGVVRDLERRYLQWTGWELNSSLEPLRAPAPRGATPSRGR